jgi:hypothetical protein
MFSGWCDLITPQMVRSLRVFAFIFSGASSLTILGAGCGAPAPARIPARPASDNGDIANPPRHLSPLREGTWTYDVVDGKGKGQTVTQVVKYDASDVSAPWRRVVSADNAIEHLREETNGAIVMTAIELLDHGVVNTFDPPLVVMPAPEALGSPLSITSQVVTTLRNGLTLGRGTAELTLTPLGAETLETPAGQFKCRVFEVRVNAKLVLGQVQSSDTLAYADGGKTLPYCSSVRRRCVRPF